LVSVTARLSIFAASAFLKFFFNVNLFEIFLMLKKFYILIDRSAWAWVYKLFIAKWRPSQHQYKKYHRYGRKTASIPPKNSIKKLKNE
jgi:hypothetical protein